MTRALAIAGFVALFVLIPAAVASAQGDGVEHGASLTAHKMDAHIFRQGSEWKATTAVEQQHCPEVHAAIERYNSHQDNPYEMWHYQPWGGMIDDFMDWLADPENAELVAGLTLNFDDENVHWCSHPHEDGAKVATDAIVNLVDDDDEIILLAFNGETVTCSTGEVLMSSATYYYNWRDGDFDSGFGTNWNDLPGGGVLFSADIEFYCLDIFDPGTDIARVIESVPVTQVNVNPSIKGLTGLDTWLWYDFGLPNAAEIGPFSAHSWEQHGETWTITTHAWIDKIMWDIDCTSSCDFDGMASDFDATGFEYVLDFEDSESRPAAAYDGGAEGDGAAAYEHIYDELGDTTVSTAAQWRGWYYVTTTDGDVSMTGIYPAVIVSESWTFPVVSVRSELRNREP